MIHFLLLIVAAAAIYFACEWFVNAIEWLGRRLNVGGVAVATIFAAFGTALPESVVTFVAVVFGTDERSKELGVGAAMGGPLVLATVAYAVVGWALLARRRAPSAAELGDTRKLARDQLWFMAVFAVKVTLGLVAFAVKPWLGLLFFAVYGVYFWREMRQSAGAGGQPGDGGQPGVWGQPGDGGQPREGGQTGVELAPLLLQRTRVAPATWAIVAQTAATLIVIFAASQLFVRQLDAVGPMLGLPAAVTALLLAPIATELPETMNAIIWVRQGKTKLALANVSGAMMIQATVPSGLGLLFTPWRFDAVLLASGIATMIAVGYLWVLLRTDRLTVRRLSLTGLLYLAFAATLYPALGHA